MLCGHTLLGSTTRPSCMHHRKGSCSRITHCSRLRVATAASKGPFTAVHGRAVSRCSACALLTHFAMVACGIQVSHNA